jgi:hypothetical protein
MEIYNTTWWGNAIDTAITAGTEPDFFGSQMKMLTSQQPELVTNGDFSDGLNNWSVVGGSYASVNNGILNSNNTVNGSWHSQYIGQNIAFVNGKTYKVKFSAKNVSGSLNLRITQGANIIYSNNLTNEFTEYVIYYTSNGNNGSIRLFCNDLIGQFEIDNVSVKLARAEEVEAVKCLADWIHTTALQDLNN